ncbi:MAG: succinylglutamate desuccinylase/aspartoacylase family protein [Cocleimonas sp.]|nr:succinylglutamate desuccinylase/aspartoacylase family protein [Cocleimonas sp.]
MGNTINIGGIEVKPGERRSIDIELPPLYTHTSVTMPVHVINGKKSGPILFVSAAVHGDEINGVEIIRRLINSEKDELDNISGTLIAVPVVNVYGFISQSRYLPDRRDLNRFFPGSEKGTMAARLAHVFIQEIASKCTHGIDLHTAAINRENLPQIRAALNDGSDNGAEIQNMACAFHAPVVINSAKLLDGSMRKAVSNLGIPILLYEAGEALRFNEIAIRAGVKGVINVMRRLKMLADGEHCDIYNKPLVANSSSWVRASQSGILRSLLPLGDQVSKGDLLGIVSDPFGGSEEHILAKRSGIVIGKSNLPLVYEGEALFHIAHFDNPDDIAEAVGAFQETHALPRMR